MNMKSGSLMEKKLRPIKHRFLSIDVHHSSNDDDSYE
jgi:hypothetical protein